METNEKYLKTLLANLKKPIPHSWRVQSYSKNKPIATVMAYIDARDTQEVLDTYCTYGWNRKHQMLNDRLYCSIGIVMPDGTIQWREDCGTESNEDKEKGQASDAFKRAGVNWGIGRFLYDMKIQYVTADAIKADQDKVDGEKVYKRYPNCINEQNQKIWDLTEYINGKNPDAPKAPAQVKEATMEEKTANMGVKKELTPEELKEHTNKITAILSADGLAGHFNALPEPLKANEQILALLKKQRVTLNKLVADGAK